jgi:hypothetical protein
MVLFSLEFVKLNALGWRSCRPSQRASTPVPVFSDRIGLANRRSFIVGVISPYHSLAEVLCEQTAQACAKA